MSQLDRLIRELGYTETIVPAAQVRQQQAAARVIDEAGRIVPDAAAPLRTPLVMSWAPASTARYRCPQAATAVLLAAYAAIPPGTGNVSLQLTMVSPLIGVTSVGDPLQITQGRAFGEVQLDDYPIPAGAWLGITVGAFNGASGISVSLTLKGA